MSCVNGSMKNGSEQREILGGRDVDLINNPKRRVFLCAEGGPAFVRALERHHAQLCETLNGNDIAVTVLTGISTVDEDVLSSFFEANVCSVVVQCIRNSDTLYNNIRTPQINDVCERLVYRHMLPQMFKNWLCIMPGSVAIRKELIKSDAVKIIIQWLEEVLESMYGRSAEFTEPKYCNICGSKAKLACPCVQVRYCSDECQREDWKWHKTLCKDTRQKIVTETIDNTIDEYQVLKETGTFAPDDDSVRAIDVIESLVNARSVDDVMRLLLALSRVPLEEMLRENGFKAVLRVMNEYEDVEQKYRGEVALYLCSLPNRKVFLVIL